jgi:hypothetical protein
MPPKPKVKKATRIQPIDRVQLRKLPLTQQQQQQQQQTDDRLQQQQQQKEDNIDNIGNIGNIGNIRLVAIPGMQSNGRILRRVLSAQEGMVCFSYYVIPIVCLAIASAVGIGIFIKHGDWQGKGFHYLMDLMTIYSVLSLFYIAGGVLIRSWKGKFSGVIQQMFVVFFSFSVLFFISSVGCRIYGWWTQTHNQTSEKVGLQFYIAIFIMNLLIFIGSVVLSLWFFLKKAQQTALVFIFMYIFFFFVQFFFPLMLFTIASTKETTTTEHTIITIVSIVPIVISFLLMMKGIISQTKS